LRGVPRQWRSDGGGEPHPPSYRRWGKGGQWLLPFTNIGDPFLQNMKFIVKKRKVMKILKNDEGLKIVIDA